MSARRQLWRWRPGAAAPVIAAGLLGLLGLLAPAPAGAASSSGSISVGLLFAGGERITSAAEIPFTARGSVGVTFHGDPSAGCATVGGCGYRGTIIAPVPRSGTLYVATVRRGRRSDVQVNLIDDHGPNGSPQITAIVDRALPGGGAARCSDAVSVQDPVYDSPDRAGRVTLSLFGDDSHLLATRCAGPSSAGLAAVAPAVTLSAAVLRRGRRTLNLTTTKPFMADGYTGTLTSSVILSLGSPSRDDLSGTSSAPEGFKLVRTRLVSEPLTVTGARGRLQAAVSGSGAGECTLLDSCGLSETIAWSPAATHSQGQLVVTGPARLPRARFLAGLGLGRARRPLAANGDVGFIDPHPASVVATQAGATCRGATGRQGALLSLATAQRRLVVSLATTSLRSACPGPFLNFPQTVAVPVARGSVPLVKLRHRSFTVRLHAVPGVLADDGYRTRMSGTVSITVRRGRLSQRIYRWPAD